MTDNASPQYVAELPPTYRVLVRWEPSRRQGPMVEGADDTPRPYAVIRYISSGYVSSMVMESNRHGWIVLSESEADEVEDVAVWDAIQRAKERYLKEENLLGNLSKFHRQRNQSH